MARKLSAVIGALFDNLSDMDVLRDPESYYELLMDAYALVKRMDPKNENLKLPIEAIDKAFQNHACAERLLSVVGTFQRLVQLMVDAEQDEN